MKDPVIMYRNNITSWLPEAKLEDWLDLMETCLKKIKETIKEEDKK